MPSVKEAFKTIKVASPYHEPRSATWLKLPKAPSEKKINFK
jgi:hypothetical protein